MINGNELNGFLWKNALDAFSEPLPALQAENVTVRTIIPSELLAGRIRRQHKYFNFSQ